MICNHQFYLLYLLLIESQSPVAGIQVVDSGNERLVIQTLLLFILADPLIALLLHSSQLTMKSVQLVV